jgi:hypothetical protein
MPKKIKTVENKATLDELLDSIEELYSRYWEREDDITKSIGFEIGEVYTLARIIKKERQL